MKKKVMQRAWELARQGVKQFGGKAREYFTVSLRMAWAEIKEESTMKNEINEKFLNSILIDVETEIAKLPDLSETGSEKQIAWAENIRRNAYMYLNSIITNAVVLGYVENRKPIYIDSERYENGTECNIDGNHYNSKKIIDSVMQVKQGVLDRYFMEMCQTAPKIIDNRYRNENKELCRYTTNCYKHM